MKKFLVGCCTKGPRSEFENSPTRGSILASAFGTTLNDDKHVIYELDNIRAVVRYNNNESLGKHYNKVIQMAVEEKYDYVILMHDDVSVEDSCLLDKIETGLGEYDILGLAGSTQTQIKSPALWHLMSTPDQWSGAVAHPAGKDQVSMTSFGATPQRCLILDGLFLAIKVSSLTGDVRFDTQFKFHHYDIDFCLTANKNGLKLTTYPIWVVHESPGLEQPGTEFYDSEKRFLNKWAKS